ncbi:peptidylprolyl isomerase [Campylobacter helveticus]|uniref:peptidylprolyl isomerase n=2 Tax=Campylobacter helveticus TaxID=28898 RepID=UPI0022EB8F37|nr:peptidylprolyl isomerase [Campylobacter helveticus]
MLTWMQRHKKYLVVTIWISVIAFVGAGVVGWGAYDYNQNRNSSVAVVGDEKISFMEFNLRYNQIYGYYNQISNGKLDEENAEKLGLKDLALNSLIEDKLLLNFAKSLGLWANEKEVIQELSGAEEFQNVNGIFDKNIYYAILKQNNILSKNYEQILSDKIILNKLNKIFELPSKENELQMLAASYFMQDALEISKISLDKKDLAVDEVALKKLWEAHKDNFKTQKNYELSSYFIEAKKANFTQDELKAFYEDENNKFKYKAQDGKILDFEVAKEMVIKDLSLEKTKNLANEKFVALRNQKDSFQKDLNISESDKTYPLELLAKAKNNDILKPLVWQECEGKICKDGFIILRLNKVNPVRVKNFEEAKAEVLPLYYSEEAKKALEEKAQKALNNFSGIELDFVSRNSIKDSKKISDEMLNNAEFSFFLSQVFNSEQNSSYVLIDDKKAILYRIKKQKLNPNKQDFNQYKTMLEPSLKSLKSNEIKQELLEELKKTYKIKIYH